MSINPHLLGDFVNALFSTAAFPERFKLYVSFIETLGFEGRVAYSFLPLLRMEGKLFPAELELTHTSHYPSDFLQHYVADDLDRYDIGVKKIRNNDFSMTDYRAYKETIGFTAEEQYFDTLATREYGCVNALSLPSLGATGISTLNIISGEHDYIFRHLMRERAEMLLHLTQLFHSVVLSDPQTCAQFTSPFLPRLNDTEIMILRYAASGKPFKNIQDHTGISYRYAAKVLDRLRDKLGGITRDRLFYLAGLLRFTAADPQTTPLLPPANAD
jgi:DNA-binding CsgD family transcriptional regulator